MRQIKPIKMNDILPSSITNNDEKPEFAWVDPETLYIEDKYQRNIADASLTLIRKIYKNFQWSRLKPPICSWSKDKLCVIDGQHTAIAAASHPKIKKIPVLIVTTSVLKERAAAFMGHNKDRVVITQPQLYYSSVAAEDDVALLMKKAMDEAGVTMVHFRPLIWVEGQTMAAGTMRKIVEKKGVAGLTRILKILMEAQRAPITALELSALRCMLWDKDWQGKFDDYDLATVIRSKTIEGWRAYVTANVIKGQNIKMTRGLALTWFKHAPKTHSIKGGIKIKSLGKSTNGHAAAAH